MHPNFLFLLFLLIVSALSIVFDRPPGRRHSGVTEAIESIHAA